MIKRINVAAIVIALAAGAFVVPAAPVQAQGLFERLFGGSTRYRNRRYRGYDRYNRYDKQRAIAEARKVRVSSPRYYTYRPDKIVNASFASLAEVDTASNDELTVPAAVTTPFAAASVHLSSFRVRTLADVASVVKAHYQANPNFIWVEEGKPNAKAHAALAVLEKADRYGLDPSDYVVAVPADIFDGDEEARERELIEFEIRLSTGVLTYVLDSKRGRIDPNRISGYHDFKRKVVDLETIMSIVASTDGIASYLETRSPNNAPFNALAEELERLRASEETQRVEIAKNTFMKSGKENSQTSNVVAAIKLRGSDDLKEKFAETLDAYDGGELYTKELAELVRGFQAENGLKPDGIVGKATIRALTTDSVTTKIRKIELAMERMRWLPVDLGNQHVFVNQPAFRVSYMHKGRDPLTMRVVVGTKANQTSFFMDKIETVEYNPYWGVPRSIILNEMLPNLYQDPSYLDRLGYEVSTESGHQVSSWSVDWFSVGSGAPINVRQPPGPGNALGQVKILFPNKHAIYMHDTPHKNLFARDTRAYSHGCIRLQHPKRMAAAVLGRSEAYISRRIAEGRNDSEPVTADIPVYVAYFTAFPTPEGEVEYFDDMYSRDTFLARALEKTDLSRQASS